MHRVSRTAVLPVLIVLAVLAGCGGTAAEGGQPPPAQMERVGHRGALSVVLTPLGAQRIGIQTGAATPAGRGRTAVPYSALLYQIDGSSVIYTVTAPFTYTLVTASVTSIQGNQVYLTGLAPGTTVVTVGGEELLGVQDGVGVQT